MKASERGEVWLVDLGLAAKVRPALVLSVPAGETDRSLVTLIPHTTSLRGSRFEVTMHVPFLETNKDRGVHTLFLLDHYVSDVRQALKAV